MLVNIEHEKHDVILTIRSPWGSETYFLPRDSSSDGWVEYNWGWFVQDFVEEWIRQQKEFGGDTRAAERLLEWVRGPGNIVLQKAWAEHQIHRLRIEKARLELRLKDVNDELGRLERFLNALEEGDKEEK